MMMVGFLDLGLEMVISLERPQEQKTNHLFIHLQYTGI